MSELNTEQKLAHESAILKSDVKSWWVLKVLEPFEKVFLVLGMKPDHITYLATLLTVPCAYFLIQGKFLFCGWITLLVGSLDILDGKLARKLNMDSTRGEFLDSVLDRIQDYFILVGLLLYFDDQWMQYVVLVIIGASTMIPYVKAKAELLGVDLKRVGMMQRPERFFTMSVGLLFDGAFEISRVFVAPFNTWPDHVILKTVLIFLGVTSVYTVIQRMRKGLEGLSK